MVLNADWTVVTFRSALDARRMNLRTRPKNWDMNGGRLAEAIPIVHVINAWRFQATTLTPGDEQIEFWHIHHHL